MTARQVREDDGWAGWSQQQRIYIVDPDNTDIRTQRDSMLLLQIIPAESIALYGFS